MICYKNIVDIAPLFSFLSFSFWFWFNEVDSDLTPGKQIHVMLELELKYG